MPTMGQSGTSATFTISGSFGQGAGGYHTVPAPGIFIDDINVFAGRNGSLSTDRLYVWKDNAGKAGVWLVRSAGTFNFPTTPAWNTRNDIAVNTLYLSSDGYIPGGWNIWIGANASTGVWQYKGTGSPDGGTDLGNTGDGDFNWHDYAHGFGTMAAYVTYHVLGAPTLSSASPNVGVQGQTTTVTGTNLLHTTGVTIGGAAASFSAINDTTLTVTVPAGATPGPGSLVVTTPAGSQSIAFTVGNGRRWSAGAWAIGPIERQRTGAEVVGVGYVMRSGIWQPGN